MYLGDTRHPPNTLLCVGKKKHGRKQHTKAKISTNCPALDSYSAVYSWSGVVYICVPISREAVFLYISRAIACLSWCEPVPCARCNLCLWYSPASCGVHGVSNIEGFKVPMAQIKHITRQSTTRVKNTRPTSLTVGRLFRRYV